MRRLPKAPLLLLHPKNCKSLDLEAQRRKTTRQDEETATNKKLPLHCVEDRSSILWGAVVGVGTQKRQESLRVLKSAVSGNEIGLEVEVQRKSEKIPNVKFQFSALKVNFLELIRQKRSAENSVVYDFCCCFKYLPIHVQEGNHYPLLQRAKTCVAWRA